MIEGVPTILYHATNFIVASVSGDIDSGRQKQDGFFFEDARFLSQFTLRLNRKELVLLTRHQVNEHEVVYHLSNPKTRQLKEAALHFVRQQSLHDGFHETLSVTNQGDEIANVVVEIGIQTDFANIFSVKSALQAEESAVPQHDIERHIVHNGSAISLRLSEGEIHRETIVRFSEVPSSITDRAHFHLRLKRGQTWCLHSNVTVRAGEHVPEVATETAARREQSRLEEVKRRIPRLETDHAILKSAYQQAVTDIADLRIRSGQALGGDAAIAAGIPWYMTLFGRDSLIASYQSMIIDPGLARGTLQSLAHLQGIKVDTESQEQPGKILHEYRSGKFVSSRTNIPKFPYYGTIDATILFLIVLSEYARWTGDLDFVRTCWEHVERALSWMETFGDLDGDGLMTYRLNASAGLSNQGWKDSGDSIRFRDGTIAKGTISLIEVQGYASMAYRRVAELAQALHLRDRASGLLEKAKYLETAIASRFHLADRHFFAEAIDGEKNRVDSITSNPGQLLWAEAVSSTHADEIAQVLLSSDMFSGFGIRTMAKTEGGYNPISYHNGSVWPHDNSMILNGLVKYGLSSHAEKLLQALLDALERFPNRQFPELFSGFDRDEFDYPISYPGSCQPQAWASGSVLLILRSLIGLEVNCLKRELSVQPLRPSGMNDFRVLQMGIADFKVDIEVVWREGHPVVAMTGLPSEWSVKGAHRKAKHVKHAAL